MTLPKRQEAKRVKAWQKGRSAERLAAWYLRFHGYRILAERYKTPAGEIDLVASPLFVMGRRIVFVEVKARSTLTEGLEAISLRQQQRIGAAAGAFLAKYHRTGAPTQGRFDAIVITPGRFGLPRITHRKNAWS